MKRKTENIRIKLTPAQKEFIYAQPLSRQFRIVHIDAESGCIVYQHVLVDDTAKDYRQVLAVAKAYAKECDCWINPEVDKNALTARQTIFPDIESAKDFPNPDLTTEKYGYVDVKSPLNSNNIIRNANDACKQGAIAVITDLMLDEKLKHKRILQITAKIFSEQNSNHVGEPNYSQDQIHWFVEGRLIQCRADRRAEAKVKNTTGWKGTASFPA